MAGVMQKRCPACGKHHSMNVMRCNGCGARLIDAPTVVVDVPEAAPPPPVRSLAPTGRWKCEACQFEQNSETDVACRLCELKRELPVGERVAGADAVGAAYVLRFPFGDVPFTTDLAIGRDPAFCSFSAQLQSFEKVSRKHAIVEVDTRSDLNLVDMGSTNGTYINGLRLDQNTRSPVKVGDEVSFSKALTGQIGRRT